MSFRWHRTQGGTTILKNPTLPHCRTASGFQEAYSARITEGTTKGKQVLEAPCYVPICLSISIIATVIRTNKCECMCGESEMLINCNLRKQNKQTYPFSICWYIFTLLLFLTIFVLIMKKLKKKMKGLHSLLFQMKYRMK